MTIHLRPIRRMVQCFVFAGFILIPLCNAKELYTVVGNLLGFTAFGVPFVDPLSATQAAIGAVGTTQEALLGAGLILFMAVILGPVFCSWICPYGFFSELVHFPLKDYQPAPKTNVRPFIVRCGIVILGLLAVVALVPFPLLNQLSLPGWITRFWQAFFLLGSFLWTGFFIILVVLGVEVLFHKRIWCRYLCPQSVLISLAGLLVPKRLRIVFKPQQCTCSANDQLCRISCSLCLNPRHPNRVQMVQCTNCGDCVDACQSRGQALSFVFGNIHSK